MANKIIKFGNVEKQTNESTEDRMIVYRDISMVASPSKYNTKPSKESQEQYEAYLRQEFKSPQDEYDYLICSEFLDPSEKYLLTLYFDEVEDYEEVLRIWKMRSRWLIAKNTNIKAIQESLRNIFTWIPGERVLNPEFGSNLRRLLYEGITKLTEEKIVAEIRSSVSRWEPRVEILQVINVSDINDTEDNTIRLDIKYKIKGLEEVYTYVYEQINPK